MIEMFKGVWDDFVYSVSWKYLRFVCWWKEINVWRDQRAVRGYSDSDIWELDVHLTSLILPRLIEFRQIATNSFPAEAGSHENWMNTLDKMILAFQIMKKSDDPGMGYDVDSDDFLDLVKADQEKIDEGLKLFAEFYQGLWD